MDQKWFISSIFGVFCFINFSNFFHVSSYTLSNSGGAYNDIDSNLWEGDRDQFPVLQENIRNSIREDNEKLTDQPASENKRWLNVLTFDKHCNLTETDKGPQNETKEIFLNTEEHLKIFENEDEEEEDENKLNSQLQEGKKNNIFHLLGQESFLSHIISEDQSRALERTKRQAEEEKRKCRCRRKRRRGMSRRRRRRRRNRTGRQRRRRRRGGRRRNGRRRGRRRCVCRKRGDEEGKSEDGEPEVEEADGEEEGTTEGGDETTTEGDGEEAEEGMKEKEWNEGEEGKEEEEGKGWKEKEKGDGGEEEEEEEEKEGSDEESDEEEGDEEDEKEKEEDEESPSASKKEKPSLYNIPTYALPYPNMVEMPIAMMPAGRVPIGSYPALDKMPSYLAIGTLLSGNSNSNIQE